MGISFWVLPNDAINRIPLKNHVSGQGYVKQGGGRHIKLLTGQPTKGKFWQVSGYHYRTQKWEQRDWFSTIMNRKIDSTVGVPMTTNWTLVNASVKFVQRLVDR